MDSYMIVISQDGRRMVAAIVEVDPNHVESDLQKIGSAFVQQYPQSTIHYANSSDGKVAVMQKLELSES